MFTKSIKGTKDILPTESPRWQRIESTARALFNIYGYHELRTPIIEQTALFTRSIGATSDIVEKEMYAFTDQGGDNITLRPEGTAGVVRAFVEHKLYAVGGPTKVWYTGPMFRRERPQAGRQRQFHQIGVEALGVTEPSVDVEVLALLSDIFERLGIGGVELRINSLGCKDCRPVYRAALTAYLNERKDALCEDCKRRIEFNPLRALDCKAVGCKEATKDAPAMEDHLDDACREHFGKVKQGLDNLGIAYAIDRRMVRGLDYYTRTTFEMVMTDVKGAQNAVAAGGRYDGLVEELGGPATPGIGFAMGVERLILMLADTELEASGPDVFIAALGADAASLAQRLAHSLRKAGLWAEVDYAGAGLKNQMKKADRLSSRNVLIIGEDEMARGVAVLRNMKTKDQEELPVDNITKLLTERLR